MCALRPVLLTRIWIMQPFTYSRWNWVRGKKYRRTEIKKERRRIWSVFQHRRHNQGSHFRCQAVPPVRPYSRARSGLCLPVAELCSKYIYTYIYMKTCVYYIFTGRHLISNNVSSPLLQWSARKFSFQIPRLV